VHIGHLIAAEAAGRRSTPGCGSSGAAQPFKRAAQGATPEQRAEMLDLAVAGNPRLAWSASSSRSPRRRTPSGPSRRWPSGSREPFRVVAWADVAAELAAWYQVDALPGLADVVVFARPGLAPAPSAIRGGRDPGGGRLRHADRSACGRPLHPLSVPDAVRDYIAARGCIANRGLMAKGWFTKIFGTQFQRELKRIRPVVTRFIATRSG